MKNIPYQQNAINELTDKTNDTKLCLKRQQVREKRS